MMVLPVILEPSGRTTDAAEEVLEPTEEGQQAFGDLFSKVLGKSISTDTHAPGNARKQPRGEMQGQDEQEPMLGPEPQNGSEEQPAGPVDGLYLSSAADTEAADETEQAAEGDVDVATETQPGCENEPVMAKPETVVAQWMLAGDLTQSAETAPQEQAAKPQVMVLDSEGRVMAFSGEETESEENATTPVAESMSGSQARTVQSGPVHQVRTARPAAETLSSMSEESKSSTGAASTEPVKVEATATESTASTAPRTPAPAMQDAGQQGQPVRMVEPKQEQVSASTVEEGESEAMPVQVAPPAPKANTEQAQSEVKTMGESNPKAAWQPVMEDDGEAVGTEQTADESSQLEVRTPPQTASDVQKGTAPRMKGEGIEPENRAGKGSEIRISDTTSTDGKQMSAGQKPGPAVHVARSARPSDVSVQGAESDDENVKASDRALRAAADKGVSEVAVEESEIDWEVEDAADVSLAEVGEQAQVRPATAQAGKSGRPTMTDHKINPLDPEAGEVVQVARSRPVESSQKNSETGRENMGSATDLFRNGATVRTAARSAQESKTFLHQMLVQSTGRLASEGGLARAENALANAEVYSGALDRIEKLQELVENIDKHVLSLAVGSDKTMTVTLVPESLGKVVVSCRETNGGQMVVEIQASNSGVKDMLQKQEDSLRQMLEQNGYRLAQFDVKTQNDNGRDRRSATRADRDAEDEFEPVKRSSQAESTGEKAATPVSQGRGIWYVA